MYDLFFKDTMSHDYIMKVVPTVYESLNGKVLYPFQFTYAHREYSPYKNQGYKIPATIWFRYELNPITVKYIEYRQPLYHFLTTVIVFIKGLIFSFLLILFNNQ